jgi:O-antigen/teichoic acid export membrane protein
MNKLFQWIKRNGTILINAGSLVGTTIVTSVLGFVYWWVAAKRFSTEVVGIASASISAMTLLGAFSIVGLGTLLITEIPRQPKQALSLISTGLMVVAVVGGCTGALFAFIAPILSKQFSPLDDNLIDAITFAGGVSLTAITLVLDQALVGLLRGVMQFGRNTIFASIKLIALFLISLVFARVTGISIYATWAVGNLLSLGIVVPTILKKRIPFKNYLPQKSLLRQLSSTALQHHILNITLQLPAYALPTIVTVLLSARMNAFFYVSWMIVNFIFFIPAALTAVLHAMNSAQQSSLADRARVTVGLALVTSVFAVIVLQVVTKQVLGIFGRSYEQAIWDLRILALAAFPIIIKNHYVSICRIHDRVKAAMWIIGPGCLLELGLAITGSHIGGLIGLSAGWVIAIYIESALMFRTVYNAIWVPKTPQLSAEQNLAAEAVWLMDTSLMPAVNVSSFWLAETTRLPVLKLPSKQSDQGLYTSGQRVKESPLTYKAADNEELPVYAAKPHDEHSIRRLKPPRLQRITPWSEDEIWE